MAIDRKKKETIEISTEHQELLVKIGKRIRELRINNTGDSYEVFAFKNGINRMSQYRLENGKNFQMATLLKILDGLKVNVVDFFREIS